MLTWSMHTLVDLPQMKSEVVKQRLQNPAAAAAGGDDLIITKSSIGSVIYTSLRRVCGGERYLRVRVCFRPSVTNPVTQTRLACRAYQHHPCWLQVATQWFRFFGRFFETSWRIVFQKMAKIFLKYF